MPNSARINLYGGLGLQVAHAIGQEIVQAAVWHGNRCNWVGAVPDAQSRLEGRPGRTFQALGPDLYGGTAGVALFLAELAARTGDANQARTALGAVRHALADEGTLSGGIGKGLYGGIAGVGYAAARVGHLLDRDEARTRASKLFSRMIGASTERLEFDVISGAAGGILGTLAVSELLSQPSLRDVAIELGQSLLNSGVRTRRGLSWASPNLPEQRHLTGYSHGAAGAALALAEVYATTGEERFARAAGEAVRYERFWYSPQDRNWPDFRNIVRIRLSRQPSDGFRYPFSTFWCHGAPGIGLARARCARLLADPSLLDEADVALSTTRAALETWLRFGEARPSLCHGLIGNAEILLECLAMFESQRQANAEAIQTVAEAARSTDSRGMRRFEGTESETPGLMLGVAGLGYFFLHLHDPTVPSPLAIGPGALEHPAGHGSRNSYPADSGGAPSEGREPKPARVGTRGYDERVPLFFDVHVCQPPATSDLIGREMDFECRCGWRWRLEHYFGKDGSLLGPSWVLL